MVAVQQQPVYATVQQPNVQYVMTPEVYGVQTVMETVPVQTQPIYTTVQQPQMMPAQIQQPMMAPQQQMVNAGMVAPTNQSLAGNGSLIILQHPVNRDLVKCEFGDSSCLSMYETQGYVQLRNAPHFAGYNDVPSDSDYPARRWRENNNIPRW